MAKFSGNIYKELNKSEQEKEITKILPMLQEMMSDNDFNRLRDDYHSIADNPIPFWKYVFDNVEVKYCK